jgi:hypothetical protein
MPHYLAWKEILLPLQYAIGGEDARSMVVPDNERKNSGKVNTFLYQHLG